MREIDVGLGGTGKYRSAHLDPVFLSSSNCDVGLERGCGWPIRILPLVDYTDAVVTR